MTGDAELACGLAEAGLPLIAIHRPARPEAVPSSPERLRTALLASGDPLFVLCVVPLLVACPQASQGIAETQGRPDAAASTLLMHLHTAAVCLQHLWKTRLALAGCGAALPDLFSETLRLPSPKADYGRSCLAEIASRLERGDAGARIRGADRMIGRLVDQMFAILEHTSTHATAR
jgi:hypothetical protein